MILGGTKDEDSVSRQGEENGLILNDSGE
jgi:hypothetical protein